LRQPPAEALFARREGYGDKQLVAADPVALGRERELSFIRSPLSRRCSIANARR
jgi:hypothetical protein